MRIIFVLASVRHSNKQSQQACFEPRAAVLLPSRESDAARPALAWIAALALASAFVPLRPRLLQLKPVSSTARRRTLLRMSDEPRSDNGTRDDEFDLEPRAAKDDAPTAALAKTDDETNPYYKVVAALSPGEIIGRFAATAPPRVQDAVKQTIMGLLGNAGSFALETATVTTSEKLANLMFQLQMTGYMFKNAEYRLSLSRSLQDVPALMPGEDDGVEASSRRRCRPSRARFPQGQRHGRGGRRSMRTRTWLNCGKRSRRCGRSWIGWKKRGGDAVRFISVRALAAGAADGGAHVGDHRRRFRWDEEARLFHHEGHGHVVRRGQYAAAAERLAMGYACGSSRSATTCGSWR